MRGIFDFELSPSGSDLKVFKGFSEQCNKLSVTNFTGENIYGTLF